MYSTLDLLHVLSLCTLVIGGATDAPTAQVRNGTYIGRYSAEYDQDFFLGVPYAQPAVGDLRFRQAQSLNDTWEGAREAWNYSPLCVGYGLDQTFYSQSEDCLTLNVVRPSGYTGKSLPVGLWIHGGSFTNGGGGDQRYNLSFIVDQSVKIGKPFIGVSINYRLHAWGFLSSNELASEGLTNTGLRDQRLALQWVQENIKAFGGDNTKVTIFGESSAYAGRNDNLFRAAIMQSGNPIFYSAQKKPDVYQAQFDEITASTGCNSTASPVQCLQQVPFEQLNATLGALYLAHGNLNPVIDGDIIQNYGSVQLQRGEFVRVPIIVGANSDEGAAFGPQGISTTADFKATLAGLPAQFQDQILEAYPDDLSVNVVASLGDERPALPYGAQFRRSASYYGDVNFIAQRRQTAATWAANGLSAYSFRFNAIPHGVPPEVGAGHFKKIGYVFRNFLGTGFRPDVLPFKGMPQGHYELARLMSSSWVSFISDLDPNAAWVGGMGNSTAWSRYSVDNPTNFVFDANVTSHTEVDDFRKDGIELINGNALEIYNR
ncbi:hypothetical protein KVR01_013623 [Diaporthe batatas]|uniref:uncharacterized protein n=1 Tax=Diaporthe batatas TaxID=748121 RepID=UPI001D03ADDD|nr:uncharacterized protein KVR01_013623 [Diaporthe batatas]KAG8156519.1 hypothetical protein KVR01_013623 [Diaporthe batatas]